jgi:hypothetical protein
MRLRIASLCVFFVVGAWAAYGQTSITPSQLPNSTGCSLPFASAASITCITSNQSYSAQFGVNLTPNGGLNPTWTLATGSIPSGLTLDSGTGLFHGTPTSVGVYSFTVNVTYANINTIVPSGTYTIASESSALTVAQTPLHAGAVGVPFAAQQFSATGGFPFISGTSTASYKWSFGVGSTPDGLVIDPDTGIVSGTPTSPGVFSVTIGAIDALGDGAVYRTALTVTGNSVVSITNSSTLPAGAVGTFYSQQITAIGGTSPYTFTLVSGALPPGLSLSSAGLISGTPTTNGTLTFSITATDATALNTTANFSLTIGSTGSTFSSALRLGDIVDGGGWSTLISIVNLDTVAVTYTTNFWGDSGNAFQVPIVGGTPGVFTGTLAPGAVAFAQTAGTASQTTQGWAEVSSSGHIGVESIFRYTATGVPDSQGTVTGMTSSSSLYMPYDNNSGYTTGVALANTNSLNSLNVTMTFTSDSGNSSSGTISLPAHGHTSFVLSTQFPFTANTRGVIHFSAPTTDLTVTGFRFTPSLSFTSLTPLE